MAISKKDQLIENILNSSDTQSVDWDKIVSDPENFENIMSIVVKSHSGKKKTKVSKSEGNQLLAHAQGSYADVPFHQAFTHLIKNETIRRSAKKIGISPAFVYNLKTNKAQPSIELMGSIANTYKVHPCFFLEYRTYYILNAVKEFLHSNPETATSWFALLSKGEFI